jgi:hypothetical protein
MRPPYLMMTHVAVSLCWLVFAFTLCATLYVETLWSVVRAVALVIAGG